MFLDDRTYLATELRWRVYVNARLNVIADLVWQLPKYFKTTSPTVIEEANRVAAGVIAKQERVSLEGSAGMRDNLEKWALNAIQKFLEGDWQSIDNYKGKPIKPPKMSKKARTRHILAGSAIMAAGLALVAVAVVVGGRGNQDGGSHRRNSDFLHRTSFLLQCRNQYRRHEGLAADGEGLYAYW